MNEQITNKLELPKKEVDDVLGGEEAWKNVDRTESKTPPLGKTKKIKRLETC
jgi:DNA-directed RNA polymerase III subunit RPC11